MGHKRSCPHLTAQCCALHGANSRLQPARMARLMVWGATGAKDPHSLLLVARVHVESLAVVLDSEDGPPVIHAGLSGLTGVARKYPETLNVRTAVRGGAVTAPEGNLLHAGVAMPNTPATPHAPTGRRYPLQPGPMPTLLLEPPASRLRSTQLNSVKGRLQCVCMMYKWLHALRRETTSKRQLVLLNWLIMHDASRTA